MKRNMFGIIKLYRHVKCLSRLLTPFPVFDIRFYISPRIVHTIYALCVVVTVAVTVSFSLTVSVTVMNTVSFPPFPPFGTGIIVNPSPPDPAPPVMIVDVSGEAVGSGC